MNISIVVPLKNEISELTRFLNQISTQTLLPSEVLFIDADSKDGTAQAVAEIAKTKPFSIRIQSAGPHSYPGRSRNLGLRAAATQWVAFMDMGIAIHPTWLANLVNDAKASNYNVVFGRCTFAGKTLFSKAICALTYGLGSEHETVPGALVDREALISKGITFPEHLRAAEDVIWKSDVRENLNFTTATHTDLAYDSFPDSWSKYLGKRVLYATHEGRAGFHKKHLFMAAGWWGVPLALIAVLQPVNALPLFVAFWISRGIIDPIRRSPKMNYLVLGVTPLLVLIGDQFAIFGYLRGILSPSTVRPK